MARLVVKRKHSIHRFRRSPLPASKPVEVVSPPVELWAYAVERYPERRIELVDGRVVIKPMPGKIHNQIVFALLRVLMPLLAERAWEGWGDITLFFGVHEDRFRPDLTVVPREPRMWSDDHVHADEALMVVEVVSPSSVQDDHEYKPGRCAKGKVPLYLVIDPAQEIVRLLSQPTEDGYDDEVKVPLGEKLSLPAPFDLVLDTAQLLA
ncbi:Uma2 family endonuclease [Microtetraspora sp. AC03309]|uniref:Uma2 family endonuclease n=1 Tax=Microtetraspora sp. AC03309 TaxID=2779376 RepID=UPI001E5ED459|nr:Uma2 family endonuclease [Microtetraspora sp. AC03309]MCC5574938.1 Uma2 family endonuclease [Microtetraspora sp. AC03309]